MSKDSLFRIYSMTKPIVAATAMSIWEEGKFKLDDPISAHCPEWKEATVREKGKKVPAKNPITPRHLMTHSSGLTYSRFMAGLKQAGITLDRKVLSEIAATEPAAFSALVGQVKAKLAA